MEPRPIDPERDLPAVADLLGRTRASGGLSHPGGIQWWLRELWRDDRDDVDAYVWADGGPEPGKPGIGGEIGGQIGGFALVDGTFAVIERREGGPSGIEQIEWLEEQQRARGRDALEFHVAQGDSALAELQRRGYEQAGTELELLADTSREPPGARLPSGFRLGSLADVTDEAYVAGHRAAWSDTRPSSYSAALHDVVKRMPQFREDLVTVALAPDETVAACCIGWMDERSATLEIEPLGTHRDFRRLGLGRAIVREVQHRAWAAGAKRVLVWNDPSANPRAYGLYTGAGMPPNRTLIELRRDLAGTK